MIILKIFCIVILIYLVSFFVTLGFTKLFVLVCILKKKYIEKQKITVKIGNKKPKQVVKKWNPSLGVYEIED